MKLTAKVTAIYSADRYKDGKQRVQIHVEGGDTGYASFIVPNDGLVLDDEVTLLVLTKHDAAVLYREIDDMTAGRDVPYSVKVADLLDQLRPDPPPPWEQTKRGLTKAQTAAYLGRDATNAAEKLLQSDDADTQEFRLGGTV